MRNKTISAADYYIFGIKEVQKTTVDVRKLITQARERQKQVVQTGATRKTSRGDHVEALTTVLMVCSLTTRSVSLLLWKTGSKESLHMNSCSADLPHDS